MKDLRWFFSFCSNGRRIVTKQELKDYGMKVTQASRTGLIVIMYEITVKYLSDACECFEAGNTDEFRFNLRKAKSFINELSNSLDMSYPISGNLFALYMFMNNALVRADIRNDISETERIIGMLKKLQASFAEAGKTDESGPLMENTQQVYAGLTYSKSSLNENMYSNGNRGFTV